ncbi:MAG: CPBP family intramembrane metalloprotease [Deltaproteobacteria bacterium]|nr:CPBP family intramembrane metalloprotease [Deltaproteobacteria bacterium]
MSERPSILSRVGLTLFVLLVMLVTGTVAAMVGLAITDNLLFVTALTWALAAPILLFSGPRLMGLGHRTMGTRQDRDAPQRPRYLIGTLLGLGLVLLPALVGRLAGGYQPMPGADLALLQAPSGTAALPAIVYTLPALMLSAAGEELLFRGVLLRLWQPVLKAKGALVLSALFFVAVHAGNPGADPRGALGVFIAGIALGALFLARGDLWMVAGAHLGWNMGEALVIGVPVSGFTLPSLARWQVVDSELWQGLLGGSFGPEEGLLFHGALGLAAVAGLVFAAAHGAFADPGGHEAGGSVDPIASPD